MKKLVNVSVLFGVVALILLLITGPAGAAPAQQMGPPGWGWGEHGAVTGVQGSAEAEPDGTALRINFDVGGHKAHNGLYVVRYPGGDTLASWSAHNGATDSGWINVEITRKTVWVEVVYYPGPNAAPTVMRILNPAPGTAYGWVSQGMAHAIEVAWPDMPVMSDHSMPMRPDGMPWGPEGGVGMSGGMMGMPGGMMGMPGGMPGMPGGMSGGPGGMPGGPGGMAGGPGGMAGGPGGMPGRPGG